MPPVLGVYPGPLLLAAGYGLLTAAAFALWPLGRAARIPGGGAVPRRADAAQRTAAARAVLVADAVRWRGAGRR